MNQLIYILVRGVILIEMIIVNVYCFGVLVNMIIGGLEKVKEIK